MLIALDCPHLGLDRQRGDQTIAESGRSQQWRRVEVLVVEKVHLVVSRVADKRRPRRLRVIEEPTSGVADRRVIGIGPHRLEACEIVRLSMFRVALADLHRILVESLTLAAPGADVSELSHEALQLMVRLVACVAIPVDHLARPGHQLPDHGQSSLRVPAVEQ